MFVYVWIKNTLFKPDKDMKNSYTNQLRLTRHAQHKVYKDQVVESHIKYKEPNITNTFWNAIWKATKNLRWHIYF